MLSGHDRLVGDGNKDEAFGSTVVARRLASIISALALLAAVAHMIWPELTIDSITVALIVAGVFPWMGVLLTRFKIGNFEGEFRDLWRKIEKGVAEVKIGLDRVDSGLESNEKFSEVAGEALSAPRPTKVESTPPKDQLRVLTERYNVVRERQPSGYERTAEMTRIAVSMGEVATQVLGFPWAADLFSDDRGVRLAAYAYLMTQPSVEAVVPLVKSITEKEDKPFGQYWGLRALGQAFEQRVVDSEVAATIEPTLRSYSNNMKPGTDRRVLVEAILKLIEQIRAK